MGSDGVHHAPVKKNVCSKVKELALFYLFGLIPINKESKNVLPLYILTYIAKQLDHCKSHILILAIQNNLCRFAVRAENCDAEHI